mgnify:FL=1
MPPTACHPCAPTRPVHPAPHPPQTALLVEDSRFAAEAVRLICRRAGIRLRRADSLALARQHLRVYRPDIALVDLGLPDGSGLELIDQLNRAEPRIGQIIALTGDPMLEQAAWRAGADVFWEKPLQLSGPLAQMLGVAPAPGDPLPVAGPPSGPTHPPPLSTAAPWPRHPDRNMGADPLALRDDLLHAQDLLLQDGEPARIGYAAQFLAGIARSMGDRPLLALAERVRASGEAAPLIAHLNKRVAACPPF